MKKSSIRSKILISIIGITLLTAMAIAVVFYEKTAQMIEENYITVLTQRTRLMTDTIDNMMKNVCNIGIKASCDEKIKEQLELYDQDGDESRLEEISERMRAFAKEDRTISSLYMVISREKQVVTTLDYPVYKSEVSEKEIQNFEKNIQENPSPVILDDLVHNGEKIIAFVEDITDAAGNVLGYVCVNIEENNLRYSYLTEPENADLSKICLLHDGKIVASRTLSVMGNTFDKKKYGKWIEASEVTGSDRNNIYIYCEGGFSRCGIFVSAKRSMVLSDLEKMQTYIFGMTAVFVLVAVVAAFYITRIVYRPVQKLMKAMKKVSDGELTARAEVISEDEIGMAAEEFNRMLDQIEELIRKLLEEEHKKKDAELEALQYQITPHFMYNTLNSIKCYAYIHHQNEIAEVMDDFVELLQACIRKKGAFMTVVEEVKILENYIRLQEFRNGEKYQTQYQIEREARQCLIPRLILQPIVENAILHGLDLKCGKNLLIIRAWTEGSRLYLKVEDNGRGMTKEKIDKLLSKKGEKTRGLTAIGIPNILDRLQLYYGDEAKLLYESEGEGTTALIYMPVNRNEEQI